MVAGAVPPVAAAGAPAGVAVGHVAGFNLISILSRTLPTTARRSSWIWPAKSNCVVAAPPFAASATTEPGILIDTGTRYAVGETRK